MMAGNIRTACLAATFLLCVSHYADGQTPGGPTSRDQSRRTCAAVQDPEGLPVEAITVSFEPLAVAPTRRGMTGADGKWCADLLPGVYVVRAYGRSMCTAPDFLDSFLNYRHAAVSRASRAW
jgi:hypothetical protein